MIAIDPTAIAEKFTRHGGAFDRGCADSYYHRSRNPHYFKGNTGNGTPISCNPGTPEYKAYMMGYDHNEAHGDKKNWG